VSSTPSRHDVAPLGDILAGPVKLPLAAGTGRTIDLDDNFDARQMLGYALPRDSIASNLELLAATSGIPNALARAELGRLSSATAPAFAFDVAQRLPAAVLPAHRPN
jgi:hypothetical protein